ncbi:hypothetical protein ACFZCY_39175 [Streptomyces sp. NPDC007983]|uniref:hypothetical protein n=1 Tax=Streptomyces sp. NPDC007983 TaxID=3364800 RepID=UPI0036E4886A
MTITFYGDVELLRHFHCESRLRRMKIPYDHNPTTTVLPPCLTSGDPFTFPPSGPACSFRGLPHRRCGAGWKYELRGHRELAGLDARARDARDESS